ncbi:MAG TPA: hypothetical protein VF441_10000, partial [Acidimicrobiia bacterium]
GGSVFMPQNLGNIAYTTARALATENGFTDGVNGVTVTVSPGARSNQLKVVISEPVTNLFGAIAGFRTTTVAKHAVAEYERPVALGSPTNQFGNDPTIVPAPAHGTPQYPDLWANVAGPMSEKNKGDATLANVCDASGSRPDNCSNSTTGPNTDYNAKGYYYTIDVGPAASSPLDVQVFDPAFVHVGDNCGNDNDPNQGNLNSHLLTSHLLQAQGLAANFNPGFPMTRADIINRYDPASTSLFCTGDQAFVSGTNEGMKSGVPLLPWTTYRVLGPDDTPADPTNNPPVAGCPAIDFPGTAGNLDTLLKSTNPIAGAPATLVKYFRQWYSICTVANPTEGAYFLQVQTATKASGSAAPAGGGHNRFSIRAGLGGSYVTSNVKVSGQDKMSIYANAQGAKPTFYLARVLPGAKGRVLVLSFFDIGDAADDPATPNSLQVQPPPDATTLAGPITNWAGCAYTPPPGANIGPPWAAFTPTPGAATCTITPVTSALFDRQWVQVRIPIPDDYTCAYLDPLGCWSKIHFDFKFTVTDTTTWEAYVEGDPVRLIE